MTETFEEFKNSFSYGARTDLTFKFLKRLPPDQAGEALRQILTEIGATLDSGSLAALHDLVVEWQERAYAPQPDEVRRYVYDDAPFARLSVPLAEARVGLITSSGHFTAGDDPSPFGVDDMTQEEAVSRISEFLREAPELSPIPADLERAELRVRHGGYDIRSALLDHNVTFPRDPLVQLDRDGVIGSVATTLYSFPGAVSQGRLNRHALPAWVDEIAPNVDVLLLVPV